MKILNLGYI